MQGVGKTSLIRCLQTSPFEKRYIPTHRYSINAINIDGRKYIFTDVAGQEFYDLDFDFLCKNIDIIIILFDVTSNLSYKNRDKWISRVEYVLDKPKILVIGNVCEYNHIPQKNIDLEISTKNNTNITVLIELLNKFRQ
jgi:GTPase SAR1 family protein